jgi:hypothetical protein
LASLTTAVPFRMRDTVLGETPLAAATIPSVTREPPGAAGRPAHFFIVLFLIMSSG